MIAGIIGAGAWGTALGFTVARGGTNCVMWSYDGEYARFENVAMPRNMKITRNMADMEKCDTWLVVTPAAFFRETMIKAREYWHGQPIIICTKGADNISGKFMSEILGEVLPKCRNFGVLSGPQFAAEVAQGVPTGSTLAGNKKTREIGRNLLNKLVLSETTDIIGTQICGVGKNAVALICGYNSVASKGENERAMILTLAWNDVVKIGIKSGAKPETFLDLCGIGDLFLSATSVTSRNFSGGMAIAQGKKPSGTVEGIYALQGLIKRAKELRVAVNTLTQMRDKMRL